MAAGAARPVGPARRSGSSRTRASASTSWSTATSSTSPCGWPTSTPDDVAVEVGPGRRRADDGARRRASAPCTPSSSTGGSRRRSSTCSPASVTSASPGPTPCASTSRRSTPQPTAHGREPALQRRHAARRGVPRARPSIRDVVRDGAARGRRPLLRDRADAGVRRRVGADAPRHRADRLPPRAAHGLRAAAERRLGARRLPPPGRWAALAPALARSWRRWCTPPSPTAARRWPTASRWPGLAPRDRVERALAELELPAAVRAEALPPETFPPLARRWPETRA